MKFALMRASNGTYEEVIELNTLEELTQLANQEGYGIIVLSSNDYLAERKNYPVLLIYDDYLE